MSSYSDAKKDAGGCFGAAVAMSCILGLISFVGLAVAIFA